MNIFEVVGYVVIVIFGIAAFSGLIGLFNIKITFTINGKKIF